MPPKRKEIVLGLIPDGAEVAQGASQTLQLTGVTQAIEASALQPGATAHLGNGPAEASR
jgi:hypothetical protein